jgi:hypothetical protein
MPVQPGLAAIAQNARDLSALGIVLSVLGILSGAVLLRPFQMTAVRILEGYWVSKPVPSLVFTLSVEHHTRRRAIAVILQRPRHQHNDDKEINTVLRNERQRERLERRARRASRVAHSYPVNPEAVLPTRLGNVLRRAETIAGERYGLNTVVTYPRLQPFLSPPVLSRINSLVDLLDTTSTFVFVFALDSILSTPLIARLDRWSAIPAVAAVLCLMCYLGAINAARLLASEYATAYDLHRFDMLAGLHRRLPDNAFDEFEENTRLSDFFASEREIAGGDRKGWKYQHPEAKASAPPAAPSTGKGSDS